MKRALLAVLALAGCTAAAPVPEAGPLALAGTHWVIESIDGKPLEAGFEGAVPSLTFAARSYSAYAGCNAMGGMYAQRGRRLLTLIGPSTAMACAGARGRQEQIVDLILRQAPKVTGSGDRMKLTSGALSLALRRAEPPRPVEDVPEAWQGTALAGQTFEMTWIDGDPLNRRPAPRLTFGMKTVTISHLCGQRQILPYRETKGSVTVSGGRASCLDGMFAGQRLTTVSGPNGELLLASDRHWLGGDNVRRDRPK